MLTKTSTAGLKIITIAILSLLIIAIFTINKEELNINYITADSDTISITGYVISFPFNKYFIKGTVSIGSEIYKIESLQFVGTPRKNENIYLLSFRKLDKGRPMNHIAGDMTISGNLMKGAVTGESLINIYDALLDETTEYKGYIKN